jgi:diguanylate cyclase (GGDEF)-like protein
VLLVDDDRQQFLLIGYLLSEAHHENYRLVWCQDLEQGLKHIESNECDVVLLDYHWGINCKDFIQRSYTLNSKIPVIVMTDDMELEVDQKAISEGASDYLVKDTINSEILERTIRYSMERKKIEHRLNYLAHYDYLTELPNRVLFLDRLNQTIQLAQRSNEQFTLMFIDLNDFKVVNDNYGHDVGDKLLKAFADRLLESVRRSDTVARIGGDEFTILLNNMSSTPKIISLAQKLIESVELPFFIDDNTLRVGCSIGISVFPDGGDNVEAIQRNADTAMYQAKQAGTSCYRFFVHHTKDDILMESLSPNELRMLISDNKLQLRYTPRIDLKTQRILGFVVNPVCFHDKAGPQFYETCAKLLGNNETIKVLTEWMLEASLLEMQSLYQKEKIFFSYSIRRIELQSPQFSRYVKMITERYSVDVADMEFSFLSKKECTQNLFFKECIENINNMGASFSLSDFGENTLSLSSINSYDIPALHFSSDFLKSALNNKKDGFLLESLIMLAHRLSRKVVANGVENKVQMKKMQSLEVDYIQGSIFGENLAYDEVLALLDNNSILSNTALSNEKNF